MKFVMCLGNPGMKYTYTRHNAGFLFADKLAERLGGSFSEDLKFKSHILKTEYNSEALWLIKPQTFMNLSGGAFSAYKSFYKLDINSLFTVYDDISLELGRIRFRHEGSDGGHNGIKSIISAAGSHVFDRLKIGIGPQPQFMKSEDFVLQKFAPDELELFDTALNKACDAFLFYLTSNLQQAQNKYNQR